MVPLLLAVGVVVAGLTAIAVNAATSVPTPWPWGLEAIRAHPFRWTGWSIVAGAVLAVVAWWLPRRFDRQAGPGERPPPAVMPPPGWVVAKWDPVDLGVHKSITAAATASGPDLPLYVERAHDREVRALLTNRQHNLMIMLTGESSTGKTRTALEAVRACLADWPVHRPTGTAELAQLAATAATRSRCIVWLNEAQEYLQDNPVQATSALRTLLAAAGPVVVLGTMWTNPSWKDLTAGPPTGAADTDTYRTVRDLLLDHATRIQVPDSFTDDPQALRQLHELAQRDPRLAIARETAHHNKITQVLSGGHELAKRYDTWEHGDASDKRARAVLTAAIEARHLGHHTPLPAGLLKDAATGYLTDTVRVADPGWFDAGLHQATAEIRGVAALTPTRAQPDVGDPDGYLLHDYLYQHGRHGTAVPVRAALWRALAEHTTDLRDLFRLAFEADQRLLYEQAEALHRRAITLGEWRAHLTLASLMNRQGRAGEAIVELRAAAAHDDPHARWRLVRALQDQDLVDEAAVELRHLAAAGDQRAAEELVGLLAWHGRADGLRELAEAGNEDAEEKLERLQAEYAHVEDLRRTGDPAACVVHAGLLIREGRVEDAIAALRTAVGSGDCHRGARLVLADLLNRHGRGDDAIAELRQTKTTDEDARILLARLLAERGRRDEAMRELVGLGPGRGYDARDLMAELLVTAGRFDEAFEEVRGGFNGVGYDCRKFGMVLARLGHLNRAVEVFQQGTDEGDRECRAELKGLRDKRARLDQLRSQLASGDTAPHGELVELLVAWNHLDEALAILDAAGDSSPQDLIDPLIRWGRHDEAATIVRDAADDDWWAQGWRAILLAGPTARQALARLCHATAAGDPDAAHALQHLVSEQSHRLPRGEDIKRFGLNPDGLIATASER